MRLVFGFPADTTALVEAVSDLVIFCWEIRETYLEVRQRTAVLYPWDRVTMNPAEVQIAPVL
jgi:hypothetical protein